MTLSVAEAISRKPSQAQTVQVRSELASILASANFSTSKRCQDFLAFVVERALSGDYDSLTERFLGVQLFGRAIDYETATDSIVRVRANDVRRRLTEYYAGRRLTAVVIIDLLPGGYIPEFHWRTEGNSHPASQLESIAAPRLSASGGFEEQFSKLEAEVEEPVAHFHWVRQHAKRLWWSGLAAVLLTATVLTLVLHSSQSNFDRFWQPVLEAPTSPVLSLPTTDTFQLSLDSTHALSQLKPGDSLKLGFGEVMSFHDWHTSLPVMQATFSVGLALDRKGKTPLLRFGTDIRRDELRGHPIISIGSFSNPWTEQNVSGLRFTFDRGASDREPPRIRDSLNPKRSWLLASIFPEPQTKDYAIVTRTFDPTTHEVFVSLAGLHTFGNQIAGEFVSQNSSWDELARRAPKGWEKMNLQIVLESSIVGTTPGSPKIVDLYFWK